MKEQDIENIIKKSFQLNAEPSKESLSRVLLNVNENDFVTNKSHTRYNVWTTMSNIINNRIVRIIDVWRYKRIYILVPTFVVLFFIGAFSLSPNENSYSRSIIKLAEQNESIKEPSINDEEQVAYTMFDSSTINDLDILENEI